MMFSTKTCPHNLQNEVNLEKKKKKNFQTSEEQVSSFARNAKQREHPQ